MSRFLAPAALVAASILIALLLAEAALRLQPRRPLAVGWVLGHAERVLDDKLIYINPAYKKASFYRSDGERPVMVTLGDSFAAGFPVGRTQSFAARVQEQLARAGAPIHLINLGLGDSGPDQHLRLFSDYALRHVSPRIVLWQFYTNDLWDNVAKSVYAIEAGKLVPTPASETWLYRRGAFFNVTPLPALLKLNSRVYQSMLAAAEYWMEAQVPPEHAHDPQQWSAAKIRLEIDEMERLARERGFRVYYVLIPPQALYGEPRSDKDVKRVAWGRENYAAMREILASRPSFIDVGFDAGAAESPTTRYYVAGKYDPNGFGDRHLNEAGHLEIARQITKRLLADRSQGRADFLSARP